MAKTLITDAENKNRIPFLRGILTRSLSEAGLSFDAAYALASDIRHELEGVGEITAIDLRKMVVKKLSQLANDKIILKRFFFNHAGHLESLR